MKEKEKKDVLEGGLSANIFLGGRDFFGKVEKLLRGIEKFFGWGKNYSGR